MKNALFLAVLMTATYANAAPPIVEPVDTFVTNDANSPVPVTGTVTGTVTGQVQVTNDISKPVPVVVNEAEEEFVVFSGTAQFPNNDLILFATTPILYTVPQDKTLIIEDVSGVYQMFQTYPDNAWFGLTLSLLTGPGDSRSVGIGSTSLPGPGANPIIGRSLGRTTKIYAPAGTNVRCTFDRNFPNKTDTAICFIHGRLVD